MSLPAAWIAHGLAVAALTWGHQPPPCGQVHIRYENLHGYLVGYADPTRCRVVLDSYPWTAWTKTRACEAIVHEEGHLYGHYHSTNPASIMYPRLHYWRPCEPQGSPT